MKKKNGFVFIETMIVVVTLITILIVLYSAYSGIISIEKRRSRYDDPRFIYRTKMLGDVLKEGYDYELMPGTTNRSNIKKYIIKSWINENKEAIKDITKDNIKDDDFGKLFTVVNSTADDFFRTLIYDEITDYKQPLNDEGLATINACRENVHCESENLENQLYFTYLYKNFNVESMIIASEKTLNIFSNIDYETDIADEYKDLVDTDFYNYLITIDTSKSGTSEKPKYYLIAKYSEGINGQKCDSYSVFNNGDNNKTERRCTNYYASLEIDY